MIVPLRTSLAAVTYIGGKHTVTTRDKLVVRFIAAFLVIRLRTNRIHHRRRCEIGRVSRRRERIIARRSDIVDIKVCETLQRAFNRRAANIIGVAARSIVTRETGAFGKCGDTLLVIRVEVLAVLSWCDELAVGVVGGVVNVIPVLIA